MLSDKLVVTDMEIVVHLPDRMLLLNVLERALNDLSVDDEKIKKGAYVWFTDNVRGMPRWVSFRDVKEHIVLDAYKSRFIRDALEKYEASQKETI